MSFLKNTAIFLMSLLVALLISEAIVRIFAPQDLRLNFSQWDEYVGFVNIPGIEGTTVHAKVAMNRGSFNTRNVYKSNVFVPLAKIEA